MKVRRKLHWMVYVYLLEWILIAVLIIITFVPRTKVIEEGVTSHKTMAFELLEVDKEIKENDSTVTEEGIIFKIFDKEVVNTVEKKKNNNK